MHVGHCLATYTLSPYFDIPTGSSNAPKPTHAQEAHEEEMDEGLSQEEDCSSPMDTRVLGGWEHVITEAVRSTRITYPVR